MPVLGYFAFENFCRCPPLWFGGAAHLPAAAMRQTPKGEPSFRQRAGHVDGSCSKPERDREAFGESTVLSGKSGRSRVSDPAGRRRKSNSPSGAPAFHER